MSEKVDEAKEANKDEKQDWAEMSNDEDDEPNQAAKEEEKVEEKKEVKKVIPPAKKGSKNARGDYVVTTIDIPDMRTGMRDAKDNAEESDSDSDEGYGDEDEPKEEKKVEEVKVESKYIRFIHLFISIFVLECYIFLLIFIEEKPK